MSRWRRIGLIGVEVARQLKRLAWPERAPERNRTYLRDRLIALPLLTVIAFTAFGWAYADVRADTAYLRSRIAPALVDLADAKTSLQIAQQEAEDSLCGEQGGPPGGGTAANGPCGGDTAANGPRGGDEVQLSGLSDRYRMRMTRSTQRLGQVARSGALNVSEQQQLSVVSALLVDYGSWISRAQGDAGRAQDANDLTLSTAELSYAQTMLCSDPPAHGDLTVQCKHGNGSAATTIVDRISALEQALHRRLDQRAAWGGGVLAAAAVSAVAFALLVAGLWRTLCFLRDNFRVWPSLPLLLAALPLLGVPLLTIDAVLAQHAQHQTMGKALTLYAETTPKIEIDAEDDAPEDRDHKSIGWQSDDIDRSLADGRLRFVDVAATAPYVVPVGLLSAAVAGATLHAYRREYLLVTRPGAVT